MSGKLDDSAFTLYASMGLDRSYRAVAAKYGVSKRAVTKAATKEGWAERLATIERQAREEADRRLQEDITESNLRHLKVMRFVQGKAIEALKTMPIESAMDALRAYGIALDKERLIRGEPTDRCELNVAEIAQRERDRLLLPPAEGGDDDDEWGSPAPEQG